MDKPLHLSCITLGTPIRIDKDGAQFVPLDVVGGHFGFAEVVWKMVGEDSSPEQEAQARRLVAAWNACQGITTDDLELLASLRMDLARQKHIQRECEKTAALARGTVEDTARRIGEILLPAAQEVPHG